MRVPEMEKIPSKEAFRLWPGRLLDFSRSDILFLFTVEFYRCAIKLVKKVLKWALITTVDELAN
jgi:hypothetical protein